MVKAQTKFVPVRDGFRFYNYFELSFPVKTKLPLIGEIDLSKIVYGLCGGMCFTALDYYHQRAEVPTYAKREEIDRRLFTYLCERQMESLQITVLVKIFQWMLMEDLDLANRMSRSELPRLKRALENDQPQVLCLIRTQGLDNPTNNHQVLATAYEETEDGALVITLYDPNHPGKQPTLTVYPRQAGQPIRVEQSTKEKLRGFFIVPYRPRANIPQPERKAPVSFSLGADEPALPFQLRWPVDSRRLAQGFGENRAFYRPFHQPGHEGVDLYAVPGANVYACYDGEVYEAQERGAYGVQVRIKHRAGDVTFRTIYAHLQRALVAPGQQVRAGERIALAGESGNALGAHLHLSLKIEGQETPGYPAGMVDPWPYLRGAAGAAALPKSRSGVVIYTTAQAQLRAQASLESAALALLPAGEALPVQGEASERAKIGQAGQWLPVTTAAGVSGYFPAWLSEDAAATPFPPSGLVVYPTGQTVLYSGPGKGFEPAGIAQPGEPLDVLGDAETARSRFRKAGQWLQVRTQEGCVGFVPAGQVHTTGHAPVSAGVVVQPAADLSVRARPADSGGVLTTVRPGQTLTVLGSPAAARAAVGTEGQWLYVRAPGQFTGYVPADAVAPVEQPAAPPKKTVRKQQAI